MRKFLIALLLWPTVVPANPIAEIVCAPTQEMMKRLVHNYGGERTAQGIRDPEQIMEVWTDQRGDWAMVVRYASGRSCIVATGEDWQNFEERKAS